MYNMYGKVHRLGSNLLSLEYETDKAVGNAVKQSKVTGMTGPVTLRLLSCFSAHMGWTSSHAYVCDARRCIQESLHRKNKKTIVSPLFIFYHDHFCLKHPSPTMALLKDKEGFEFIVFYSTSSQHTSS
ncbi:hypothetical protein CHARACLAT_003072 [Characodon lateralis]|uniref:Uncharacterized protein n=1 Tax=Characodon lateralis TaxID=208331 RepID=A0ABU7E6N7_9TELE|nr:hypothetical protein [Characodon lateralis]